MICASRSDSRDHNFNQSRAPYLKFSWALISKTWTGALLLSVEVWLWILTDVSTRNAWAPWINWDPGMRARSSIRIAAWNTNVGSIHSPGNTCKLSRIVSKVLLIKVPVATVHLFCCRTYGQQQQRNISRNNLMCVRVKLI